VIAFAGGGALETVEHGVTGVFFHRHDTEDFLAAARACDAMPTGPQVIARSARRFSREAFCGRVVAVLERLAGDAV
jgi:glycosyltransferase involved in cell wall biosynthesis